MDTNNIPSHETEGEKDKGVRKDESHREKEEDEGENA
jgi:hypothetical protein